MAVIVMAVIIFLSLMFGAELGPKVNPTTTTYVPRPDWYFFFLFEVLRVMKNMPKFTPLATIGVPTLCMIMLFLLPLYDRGPERRIERRPVALAAGLATIARWPSSPTRAPRQAHRTRVELAAAVRADRPGSRLLPARARSSSASPVAWPAT